MLTTLLLVQALLLAPEPNDAAIVTRPAASAPAIVDAPAPAKPAPATDASPATPGQRADAARLTTCIASIDANPEKAYEEAMAWLQESKAKEAAICAALADVGRGRYTTAANQLDYLALEIHGGQPGERINLLSQAGNAWMLARNPTKALASLDKAVALAPQEPDLLIDRARAFGLAKNWKGAELDLNRALDRRPNDPLALQLRAEARMQQGAFDLAVRDAEAAVSAAPADVDAVVTLGRMREAKRMGKAGE
jgi:tetratricopeptide (TPR) repeat protein